ncbi:hypothetical protein ACFL4W_04830, partial [Planctomycetota bacterium]
NGQFLQSDMMVLGKAAVSQPKFNIIFYDEKGNSLAKVLKIDFSKPGLKFQQVKLENQGWRNREALPKYFKIEFLDG